MQILVKPYPPKSTRNIPALPFMVIQGQNRDVTCISEPAIYQLIFGSKLESAERFRRWVFEQVLPSIR
ncbi:Bro-N domain-containing protein, partial [Merismopedia glauca]